MSAHMQQHSAVQALVVGACNGQHLPVDVCKTQQGVGYAASELWYVPRMMVEINLLCGGLP